MTAQNQIGNAVSGKPRIDNRYTLTTTHAIPQRSPLVKPPRQRNHRLLGRDHGHAAWSLIPHPKIVVGFETSADFAIQVNLLNPAHYLVAKVARRYGEYI